MNGIFEITREGNDKNLQRYRVPQQGSPRGSADEVKEPLFLRGRPYQFGGAEESVSGKAAAETA